MLDSVLYVFIRHFLIYPEIIASNFAYDYIEFGNFNSCYYSIGLQLETLFFLTVNNSVWNSLQEVLSYYENKDNYYENDDFEVATVFIDSNGLIYLEGWFSGALAYDDEEYVINNGFQWVFNKTSGVLYGLRIKGSMDGKYDDFRIACHTEFHMELLNYDLPEFSLYDHVTPVFGSYMIYFRLVLIPIIIIRKKCERKEFYK